jgi:hypothetical protein
MNPNTEDNMSGLKQLWARMVWVAKALEGIDDPAGDYMFALARRVERLERSVEQVERELHSRPGGQ